MKNLYEEIFYKENTALFHRENGPAVVLADNIRNPSILEDDILYVPNSWCIDGKFIE